MQIIQKFSFSIFTGGCSINKIAIRDNNKGLAELV